MNGEALNRFVEWQHGGGIAVLFLVSWCACGYLVAWMSGWHRLATRYRREGDFDGECWRFRSAMMRWGTHYNNVLTLGANGEGIYLAVFFLFRPGHPALFVPWSEISATPRERWWRQGVQFTLGREMQMPVWLFEATAERLLALRPAESEARMQEFYSRPGLDDPRVIR